MTIFRRLHLAIRAFCLCLRHDQIPALVTITPEDKKRFLAGAPAIIGPDQNLIVATDEMPTFFGDKWSQAYVAFLTRREAADKNRTMECVIGKSAKPLPPWIDTTRHGEP